MALQEILSTQLYFKTNTQSLLDYPTKSINEKKIFRNTYMSGRYTPNSSTEKNQTGKGMLKRNFGFVLYTCVCM